jgi:hypothetical protein
MDARSLYSQVLSDLGEGKITEGYIQGEPDEIVVGICQPGSDRITINPAGCLVTALIHESLHRLYPHWGERYTAYRTTYLLRRMNDSDIKRLYRIYQRERRQRISPVVVTERDE